MFRAQWLKVISHIPLPHVLHELIVSFIGNVWIFSRQLDYELYEEVIGVIDGDVYWTCNKQTFCNDTCILPDIRAHFIQKIRGNWLLVLVNPYTWGHAGFYIYDKQTTELYDYTHSDIGCIEVYQGNVYFLSHGLWQFDPETRKAFPILNTHDVSRMECYGNDLLLSYSEGQRFISNNQLFKHECVWVHRYGNDITIIYHRSIEHNGKQYPISSVVSNVLSHGPLCIIYTDRVYIWDSRAHEMVEMDKQDNECYFKDNDDLYRRTSESVYQLVLV